MKNNGAVHVLSPAIEPRRLGQGPDNEPTLKAADWLISDGGTAPLRLPLNPVENTMV